MLFTAGLFRPLWEISCDNCSFCASFFRSVHSHTQTHTHSLIHTLICTDSCHTLCFVTSLYTNCLWIHSDVFVWLRHRSILLQQSSLSSSTFSINLKPPEITLDHISSLFFFDSPEIDYSWRCLLKKYVYRAPLNHFQEHSRNKNSWKKSAHRP